MKTPRYGAKIRKLVLAAAKQKKEKYECLKCHKKKVVREGYALWVCKSCGATFAGGAYSFLTPTGEAFLRLLSSKG